MKLFLVIASQAIITGCFSLLSQAGSLGFCAPLRVHHTSEKIVGQIYVPVSYFIRRMRNFDLFVKGNQLDVNGFNIICHNLFSKFISFNKCIWINSL